MDDYDSASSDDDIVGDILRDLGTPSEDSDGLDSGIGSTDPEPLFSSTKEGGLHDKIGALPVKDGSDGQDEAEGIEQIVERTLMLYDIENVSKRSVTIVTMNKLKEKLANEKVREEIGTPTAFSVCNSLLAIGTSKGLVVIVDHAQAVRRVLGSERIIGTMGSIKTIHTLQNGKLCMAGHESGGFVVWDLESYAIVLSIDDLREETITDVQLLPGGEIGVVVYVSGFMYAVRIEKSSKPNIKILLDGSAAEIYAVRALQVGSTPYFTDDLQILGFVTATRILGIISLLPELSIIARVKIHGKTMEMGSSEQSFLPAIAWSSTSGPDVDPVSGAFVSHSTLPPSIAVLDNRVLQVYSLTKKAGKPTVTEVSATSLATAAQAIEWMSERVLLILRIGTEGVDISSFDFISGEAVVKFTLQPSPLSTLFFTGNSGRLVPTYSKGIVTYTARVMSRNRLFLISPSGEIVSARFRPWDDMLEALTADGRWLDAIGIVAQSLRGRTRYSIALPHSAELKGRLLQDKSAFLLFAFIRRFLSGLIPPAENGGDQSSIPWEELNAKLEESLGRLIHAVEPPAEGESGLELYARRLVQASLVIAVATKNVSHVLSSRFFDVARVAIPELSKHCTHWLVTSLEALVRAGELESTELLGSDDLFAQMVVHFLGDEEGYTDTNRADLETLALSLNVGKLSHDALVKPCLQHSLFETIAWYGISTRRPLMVVDLLFSQLAVAEDAGSSMKERLTATIFTFLAMVLGVSPGRTWRFQKPRWDEELCAAISSPEIRREFIIHILSPIAVGTGDTDAKAKTMLLKLTELDAAQTFSLLIAIFMSSSREDEIEIFKITNLGEKQQVKTKGPPLPTRRGESSPLTSEEVPITYSWLLLEISDQLLGGGGGQMMDFGGAEGLERMHLARFIGEVYAHRVAYGTFHLPDSLLFFSMAGLLSEDGTGEHDRGAEELVMLELTMFEFSARIGKKEKCGVLEKAKSASYNKVVEFLLMELGRYEEVIHFYLEDSEKQEEVFAYIRRHMESVENIHGEIVSLISAGKLVDVDEGETIEILFRMLVQECNRVSTQEEVEAIFASTLDEFLVALQDDYYQFLFLKAVVGDKEDSLQFRAQLPEETLKMYFRLLCEYSPGDVLAFLRSDANYPLDYCLELTRRYEIVDASLELMERTGDIFTALDIALVDFSKLIDRVYSDDESTVEQHVESVRNRLMATLGLVNRNSARLDSEEAKEMWFKVLDTVVMKQAETRTKGQLSASLGMGQRHGIYDQKINALRQVFSDGTQVMIHMMMGAVPVQTIFMKLLTTSSSQGNEFGDLRSYFKVLVDALRFEQRILESTSSLLNADNFSQTLHSHSTRISAIAPVNLECATCRLPLDSDISSSSMIFACGHCFHETCLTQRRGRTCPLCASAESAPAKKRLSSLKGQATSSSDNLSEASQSLSSSTSEKVIRQYIRRLERFDKKMASYEDARSNPAAASRAKSNAGNLTLALEPLFELDDDDEDEPSEFSKPFGEKSRCGEFHMPKFAKK